MQHRLGRVAGEITLNARAGDRAHDDQVDLLFVRQFVNHHASFPFEQMNLVLELAQIEFAHRLHQVLPVSFAGLRDPIAHLCFGHARQIVISFRKLGAIMRTFLSHLFYSRIFRLTAMLLIMLACSSLAFCGEIHYAAFDGNLQRIKDLLKDNPKLVSTKDIVGRTPLHLAAQWGHKDVAELLLAKGADVNAKDDDGGTPLHMAKSKDVAELLLAKRAEINARVNDGRTPLHIAVNYGHKDVVEVLLANKTDVNAGDNKGWTPLHYVTLQNKAIAALLLAKGAKVNARTNDGMTPLHMAQSSEVAELLLAKGADVNAKNNNGDTPLHIAAGYGNEDLTALLLANRADINAKDNKSWTPLDFAKTINPHVVELLRRHGGQK
jgi:ankyrin repeat protein